ncbi:putative E3 ubiquitin-protein ligase, partial [Spiromyces aspiralis]
EWFMLLLRELMNPLYGMFNLEGNNMTWFNMASLESSDQFFLVGVVIGLALYNAQLLDLRLPLVVYKKLLGQGAYGKSSSGGPLCGMPGVTDVTSAPAPKVTGGLATSSAGLGMYGGIEAASSSGLLSRDAQIRAQIYEMLEDLSDFRPQVTKGLRDLLHYKGDVENDFCLTYQVTYEAFGRTHAVDLVADGKDKLVTKANRLDYIHRYLNWVLNDSIQRQFEPFRRGFFYVCGGNALSLFRAEEIESIVRGSDEPITLEQLREAVVKVHPMVEQWFWRAMENMSDAMRRKFLVFVTGTDRLPAVGKLDIKVALLGEDVTGRFPTAHTCFNQLGMWLYPSYEMFEDRLFRAISESEGFGIK